MSLTDSEVLELEELLRQRQVDKLISGLTEFNEKTSPNYKFLYDAITQQKYNAKGDLIAGYRGVVLEGSSRCFDKDQMVITSNGSKRISEIKEGDYVKTPTGYKRVTATHKMRNNKKCVKVILKNGRELLCTDDHEFYYEGSWHSIKHVLSLLNGKSKD